MPNTAAPSSDTLISLAAPLRSAACIATAIANTIADEIAAKPAQVRAAVELLDGVQAGETLAVDGAGFLTDKAKVKLAKPDKDKSGKDKASKAEAKS